VGTTTFTIETQQQINWCWAAVGVSINHYFSPAATLKQCELAQKLLGPGCCGNPAEFNVAERLENALGAVNRLKQPVLDGHTLTFLQIRQQIDAGLPVCARIGWQGEETRGHFVVICGYSQSSTGEPWVSIADPYYLDSTIPYEQFVNSYLDAGVWTDTYLVV